MFRKVLGFAAVAVAGIFTLKLVLGILGFAFVLLVKLLWLALIGFILYQVFRAVTRKPPARREENEASGA